MAGVAAVVGSRELNGLPLGISPIEELSIDTETWLWLHDPTFLLQRHLTTTLLHRPGH